MKSIIQDILNRLRPALKSVEPDSLAAQEFSKLEANAKQILADMFVDMSIDAGEKLSTIKAAGMLDELNKNTATEGGKKYKLGVMTQAEIQAVQNIGRVSVNAFSFTDIKATERFAQRYWQEMGVKSPFFRAWFGDWRVNDQKPIQIAKRKGDTRTDHTNKDTGWVIRNSGKVHDETKTHKSLKNREAVPYLPYIDEIIENAILLDTGGLGKNKSENSLLMHYLYAVADIGHGAEVLKLTVEEMYNPNNQDSGMRAYALHNIEKAFAVRGRVQGNSPSSGTNTTNAIRTVADLFAAVKRMDADFKPNPVSGITNKDGTPKVMYHGSPAQFTIFDKKKAKSSGQYGRGFYFTNSQSHAGTYGQQYSVYLNVRNPLKQGGSTVSRSQVQKFLEAVAENEDYSIENYGTYDVDAVLHNIMENASTIDAYQAIQNVSLTAIGDMVEATELFNKVNGTKFDGIVAATETVAFRPEQIKSATDNIGTFDKNNPDIRYKLPVDNKAIDKTNSNEENGGIQNTTRGGHHDNRGVREGTAETAESRKHNGGTASGSATNAQTVQSWENIPKEIQQKVKAVVSEHIAKSPNSEELFYFIISMVNETENTITEEAYDRAVDLLTEALFNDAQSLHSVLFEGKWGIMGGSISDLRRSIITNVGSKQFKLPASEATNQRQAARDTLSRYQEALRDQKDDTHLMEVEFRRIARAYETQVRQSDRKIDGLRDRLKEEAKKHRKDQKIWENEFDRLLKAYDAAGRNIQKLEDTIAHQRQAARDKVEGRRKTEMRHKIVRFKEKLQATLTRAIAFIRLSSQ